MKATTIAAMVLAAAAASAATIVALKKAHEKKQNARLEPNITTCVGEVEYPIPAEDDDSNCCCEKTDTDAPKPEEADKEESAPEAGGCEGGFCSFAGAVDADDDDDDADQPAHITADAEDEKKDGSDSDNK